jgi:hypothetical protein
MVSREGVHGWGFFFGAQRKTSLIAKRERNTTQGLDPREPKPRVWMELHGDLIHNRM